MAKRKRKVDATKTVRGAERARAIEAGALHLYRPRARTEALAPKVADRRACDKSTVRAARSEW